MAGLTNQIATAIAAVMAGVPGITGASSTPVETIPNTPYAIVGPPKWTQVGGSWEVREYRYLVRCLIARVSSEDRDQVAINDLTDVIDAAFRTNVTLGGLATSTLLLTADTDKFADIGSMQYQSVDLEVQVFVMSAQSYTP